MAALVSLVLMLGLLWLLLIRPQQRQVRARQAVIRSLEVGDEVVTAGGIFGTILALGDSEVQLEVAPGMVLRVMRGAVNRRVEEVVPVDDDPVDDDPLDDEADVEDADSTEDEVPNE